MKAGQVIKHLHLKPNSVLLIQAGCSIANGDNINKLVDAINKAEIRNVALVVVNDLDDVKKLDENEMVKLGWIRVEKAKNIIYRKVKNIEPEKKGGEEQKNG